MSSSLLFSQLEEFAGNEAGSALKWMNAVSICSAMLLCKVIYEVMRVVSPVYWKQYRTLSNEDQVEWDNRAFSTVHALFVTVVAGYLLFVSDIFSDSGPYGPVCFRSTVLSQFVLGVSTGYFLSDLLMIIWFYPSLGGWEYLLHHFLSIGSLVMALYFAYGHIYIYIILFSESTTPFVNLRWYLNAAGMKGSTAYVVNGLLMFFGWLGARVILFVYFFIHIYLHFDQVRQFHPVGFAYLFTCPPALGVMNVYWFYKIAAGIVRTLSKKSRTA